MVVHAVLARLVADRVARGLAATAQLFAMPRYVRINAANGCFYRRQLLGQSQILAGIACQRQPSRVGCPTMGELGREEAGSRCCIVLLLDLLSGPRQDIRRRIVAYVRADGCPWAH
jgi:hypothetical protein